MKKQIKYPPLKVSPTGGDLEGAFGRFALALSLLFTLICSSLNAQTVGPLTLSSPGATGVNNSTISVRLNPGFTSTAPFSAAVVPLDCSTLTTTPTQTANYIITSVPRIAGYTDWTTLLSGQGTCQLMQTVQYVDGLGRPIQTVQVMGSPALLDVVQPQAYDRFGRELNKYLPYVAQSGAAGSYRSTAVSSAQQSFYTSPPAGSMVSRIDSAHAGTLFDNSPLNRPIEQGAPGIPWQLTGVSGGGHTVKMDYKSNNDTAFAGTGIDTTRSRQAALYTTSIAASGAQTLLRTGNSATYSPGSLTVTIAKDENWTSGRSGTVEEYKDIDGKVVLKRIYNYTGSLRQQLSTYYVYDDFGRLAFVLPPGAKPDSTAAITSTTLNDFCYQYRYDGLGRQIQKKLPGKGWEYVVYNKMDQVVATQDSLQHKNKQWLYTKYDAQGRVIITGIWANGGTDITRTTLQARLDTVTVNFFEAPSTGTTDHYTNAAWPTSNTTPLTYNYYDSYSNPPTMPSKFTAPAGADLATRGQLVATKTAVLNTPADMLWTKHYYDYFGRSLTAYSQHYLGGTVNSNNFDRDSVTYDFTNAPTTTTRKHWISSNTSNPLVTIFNKYLYDHMGRKVKTWENIANGANALQDTAARLISKIEYNEIGQVKTKSLHSKDSVKYLQPINYTYNERGWLLSSTADLFEMKLQYNTGTNKQYNGNIAYQQWGTRSRPDSNTYTYAYDKLNRLVSGASTDRFKEQGIIYDVMGNISKLNRYQAGTLIDSLAYTYSGNRATAVNDRSSSNTGLVAGNMAYTFDGNGNVIKNVNGTKHDQDKNIGYNLLNLPYADTTSTGIVTYTYDAGGRKLRKKYVAGASTTTTEYIDGIQYLNSSTAIDFIATEEGRATPNGSYYDYQYYLGDNLGNTRVTFGTKSGSAVAYQRDDYYPFGLEINRTPPTPDVKNKYLYNKKELQEELGQYDYGARLYDPVIARWQVVDPLAEVSRRWSPYNYVVNNPIRMTDPDGMSHEDESPSQMQKRHNKEFDERIAKEKQAFEDAKNGATIGISSDYQVQDNQPVGESNGNVATGTLNSKEDGGKKDKIADRGNADVDQGSFPLASPTDPNVFVFRLRDNLIHTNIFYSENYIYIDFDEIQKSKIEHVLINSINVWIPNESFFQNKFWLHKLPYLRDAFAAIVDDVRATVNEEWMNGRLLRGAPVMKQRFMQLFRSRIQEGFPGAIIDFGPNASTFTRSLVVHNVL